MKKFLAILGAIGAAVAFAYTQRYKLFQLLFKLSPAQNGVIREKNLRVQMADGVALATDVYRVQANGRYPTILIRTPYGQDNFINVIFCQLMAERGYNVVSQDVRGRGHSDGEFEPYVTEAADGATTLNWIANMGWSDGQVGMWGQSYVGYTQWAAATQQTPYLKALVPSITMAHLGYDAEAGLKFDIILNWLYILDTLHSGNGRSTWENFRQFADTKLMESLIAKAQNHLPLTDTDVVMMGKPVPFYKKWVLHHGRDDGYWASVDYRSQVKEITVPTHHVSGWYDIFLEGQLADYSAQKTAAAANGTMPPYLTVGGWTHLDFECQAETLRQSLDWYDVQMKGKKEKLRPFPVRLFVMGANEWRDYVSWPPAAAEATYYLHENGRLASDTPFADSPADNYQYDPSDPTPHLGGALLSNRAGAVDNRSLESRPDVLTYTTAVLEQPLEIIGNIELTLFIQSTCEHTDFVARLCDVQPDGRSLNLSDGFYHLTSEKGTRLADGTTQIQLNLSPVAYQFKVGHRLRLQVSSGAHPRIARNLGTGEDEMSSIKMVTAYQTIFHDEKRPSVLTLPVQK